MPDTPSSDSPVRPPDAVLEQTVIGIIARKKKLDLAAVSRASTFQDLGIDSLDGIDLVFTFEDEFNVSIPDHVVQKMKSVGQAIDALREVLDKRAPSQA